LTFPSCGWLLFFVRPLLDASVYKSRVRSFALAFILPVGDDFAFMGKSSDPLTLPEAAAEAGLNPGTLRVQIHNGRLEAKKIGRDWVVTRAALRDYLNNRAPQGRRAKDRYPGKGGS
jgi:hypothetical protein